MNSLTVPATVAPTDKAAWGHLLFGFIALYAGYPLGGGYSGMP